jgi:probable addiction module antidote protein
MSKYRKFKEYHIEQLRDPEDARIYLSVALEEYEEDGDIEAFLLALKDVAEARGGLSKLSGLTYQSFYKALLEKGNTQLNTLGAILHGIGFKFSIEPLEDRPQAEG